MKDYMESRVVELANYILATHLTIREISKKFGVSKSAVHLDLTERLARVDVELYLKVEDVLLYNKSIRHIKGGESTRRKYLCK